MGTTMGGKLGVVPSLVFMAFMREARWEKMEKYMIEAQGLVHEYSRRDENGDVTGIVRAIDGIDIQVKPGAFVAVLGANGSGKSTFARHLNALLFPTEGTLYIDGIDTADKEQLFTVRQRAGMVFQNPDNQIISSIVEEDVAFGPENMGVPTEQLQKRVTESLKSVGMEKYRRHSPNHLSGGQKQKVAIAGIMAMKPRCIILDEATAMLDPRGRRSVLETVMRLNKEEGITIILITHYMEEAVEADSVYVLHEGKLAAGGTPREIFARGSLLQEWGLELPDMIKLAQGLRAKGYPLAADTLTMEELISQLLAIS